MIGINKNTGIIIPAGLAVIGLLTLFIWFSSSVEEVEIRVPGRDNRPAKPIEVEKIEGQLQKFGGKASDIVGAWPCFRGEKRDGIYRDDNIRLAQSWPEGGPKRLWQVDMGEGHAGAAVRNGRVYVDDYNRAESRDVIRCLSLADGQDIWQFSYPVKIKRNHGMSRTVPAVTDKYIVTLGPKCHVFCLDALTGKKIWYINLVQDYGTTVPQWYAGQCPLIDGDRAIIAPGGKDVLIMAVALDTGKVIWKSPNPQAWKMTHSSILPIKYAGKKMYVYCGSGGVAGVSAEDGKILWQSKQWKISIATVPTPVDIGDGRIFFSGGYNSGSMMMKLTEHNGIIEPEVLFRLPAKTFGAAQHTPILYKGHIYGIRPDGQLVCLDLNGKILWNSGGKYTFGIGPFMIANDLIYAMDNEGLLRLCRAESDRFELLAEAKVLPGPDSWGPMAMVAGRLILRDLTHMICLDVTSR